MYVLGGHVEVLLETLRAASQPTPIVSDLRAYNIGGGHRPAAATNQMLMHFEHDNPSGLWIQWSGFHAAPAARASTRTLVSHVTPLVAKFLHDGKQVLMEGL